MRVKQVDNFLEYPKIESLQPHYIKYIEPVFKEEQNTLEKCWSFQTKVYEITELKKAELKQHNIPISPSDYEWVIDIFEKTAINDNQQSKKYLIESFRNRAPPEVAARVTDRAMEQIYDYCWKGQRE